MLLSKVAGEVAGRAARVNVANGARPTFIVGLIVGVACVATGVNEAGVATLVNVPEVPALFVGLEVNAVGRAAWVNVVGVEAWMASSTSLSRDFMRSILLSLVIEMSGRDVETLG